MSFIKELIFPIEANEKVVSVTLKLSLNVAPKTFWSNEFSKTPNWTPIIETHNNFIYLFIYLLIISLLNVDILTFIFDI